MDNKSFLKEVCEIGSQKKNIDLFDSFYKSRFNEELSVICDNDLENYFLNTSYLINKFKEKDIFVTPGRGSSASSLVCYLLNITDVDPIKYDLLFSRFLNKARVENGSLPDIDSDISKSNRQEALKIIKDSFSNDTVFSIPNFIKLQVKNGIKNISKALGIDFKEVNKFTNQLPSDVTLESLKELSVAEDFFEKYPQVEFFLEKLYGVNISFGTHAGAQVILPSSIENYASSLKVKDHICLSYDKRIEDDGILKLDMLGLQTADIIADTIKLANVKLPKNYNDFRVFETINNNPLCCFQVETQVGVDYLSKVKLESFEDCVNVIALIRPGAAKDKDKYIDYKKNPNNIEYDHDDLKPILKDTLGLLVYQEQLMHITKVFGGFSDVEADSIRKGIGKKKMDLINSYKQQFISKGLSLNYDKLLLESLWERIEDSGDYAFNKSHSVAYAINLYYCGWLKTYYPKEFLITAANYADDFKRTKIFNEMKQLGVKIFNPDINNSDIDITLKDNIHLGLAQIDGLGPKAIEDIINNRPYKSFEDFLNKTTTRKVNIKVIRALIEAGAFDSLGYERDELYYEEFPDEGVKKWSTQEKLMREYVRLKLSPNQNLINYYENEIKGIDVTPLNKLDFVDENDEIYIKGLVNKFTPKKGYGYLEISDGTSVCTISINEVLINKYFDLFKSIGKPLLIKVKKFNDKYYMSFLIDLSADKEDFKQQYNYIFNKYDKFLEQENFIDYNFTYGIIKDLTYFTSKKGTNCVRMTVSNGQNDEEIMSCKTKFNDYPEMIASDIIKYNISKKPFANIEGVLR